MTHKKERVVLLLRENVEIMNSYKKMKIFSI